MAIDRVAVARALARLATARAVLARAEFVACGAPKAIGEAVGALVSPEAGRANALPVGCVACDCAERPASLAEGYAAVAAGAVEAGQARARAGALLALLALALLRAAAEA